MIVAMLLVSGLLLTPINAESSQSNYQVTYDTTNIHAGGIQTLNEIFKESERLSHYKDGYTTTKVNIREYPNTEADILKEVKQNTKIKYIATENEWTKVICDDIEGYICSKYVSNKKTEIVKKAAKKPKNTTSQNNSEHLTKRSGVYWYNSQQRETYYNLNMNGVVRIMRRMGYTEEKFPYWVRSDGCKMFGNYIMVAANLNIYPRGSIIQTSLGTAIVADTGAFIYTYPLGVDIAVTW